jgi:hypothetical protein
VQRLGVGYIVVNRAEILRRGALPFSEKSGATFYAFVSRYLDLVFEHKVPDIHDPQWVQVYSVKRA